MRKSKFPFATLYKDDNNIFDKLMCLNFGSKFLARHAHLLLCAAHMASDFTCVYCTAAETFFGATDEYEIGFSFLSIGIFSDTNSYTKTHKVQIDISILFADQLSAEQPHHLSIKDIGIILDRLNSKIIDVVMLERQIEDTHTRNWTIKATIRGQVMRELGVIYNSNYYAISEHPNFSFSKRLLASEGKK